MRLGANSVLFGGFDMETAFKHIAMAGYDGVEVSAIDGMSEHLLIARWQEIAPEVKRLDRLPFADEVHDSIARGKHLDDVHAEVVGDLDPVPGLQLPTGTHERLPRAATLVRA